MMKRAIFVMIVASIALLTGCNKEFEKDMLAEATKYTNANKWNQAEEAYQEILKKNKKSEKAYVGLSNVYIKQGKQSEAIDLMKTAIKENKTNAAIYSVAANVFLENNERGLAIAAIQKGLDIDMNEGKLYSVLKAAYDSLGNDTMATDGEKRISIGHKNPSGYIMAFFGYFEEGKAEKALEIIKPFQKKITNERLLVRLALSYQMSGKESAANEIMEAIELDTIKSVTTLTDILFYYHTIGKTDTAVSIGKEMLKKHKNNQLFWTMYQFTKDDIYLKELGLVKWDHALQKGDNIEVASISDDGDITFGSRNTEGEYWEEDFHVTTLFERVTKAGKEKWIYENNAFGNIEIFEHPEGQSYYHLIENESMFNPLYALDENGKEVWRLDDAITKPVFGSDGTVYVGVYQGERGFLQAIDMNGKVKWSFPVEIPHAPVVGSDGTIYTSTTYAEFDGVGSSEEGAIYAINPDGSMKWSYKGAGAFSEPKLGENGFVYTSTDTYNTEESAKIYGFTAEGEKFLEYPVNTYINGGDLHLSKDLVLFNEGTSLIAINNNGEKVWEVNLGADYLNLIDGDKDNLFVSFGGYSTIPKLILLSRQDGTIKWEYVFEEPNKTGQQTNVNLDYQQLNKVEAGKNGIHVLTENDGAATYWMIDQNGKEVWKENLPIGKTANLSVGNGEIFLSSGSKVRVLDESFMSKNRFYIPVNPFTHVQKVSVIDNMIEGEKTEIHYPSFKYWKSPEAVEKLNRQYKTAANNFKKSADEMIKVTPTFGGVEMLDFNMQYEVTYNQKNVISVLQTVSEWAGGVHPNSYRESAVVDMMTGQELTLKDLLGENYKDIVNDAIQSQMYLKGYTFFEEFTGIQHDPKFYLTDNAITVYFDVYEYTPYVVGFPEFTIPYLKLSDGI
ncbi:DUF3298 domain-containing protein [Cytobacillus praedii]|uniref:DUF3298 domain-containing protein n=1 Tax=Cytobacillus praedii TaxID=1742358 RepID=UPI002E22414F|nr:PQQ-binding-like beta-propeller repeat protein [Cytobacillus praedii]